MNAVVRAVGRNAVPKPPLRSPISITPSAKQRLQSLYERQNSQGQSSTSLQQQQDIGQRHKYIKLFLRTKGCSGNAYALEWTPKKEAFDEEVQIVKESPFSLLIEGRALMTVIGSEMDYKEDKLSAGFVFNNPNIKETCGCGTSFVV
ncbi:hypothetical protein MIR68_008324 [Amoeboaphelidium protococcarum]|nr:hypothetical protein MIR68_008324 [Amoeboaphelidium protococcarum]